MKYLNNSNVPVIFLALMASIIPIRNFVDENYGVALINTLCIAYLVYDGVIINIRAKKIMRDTVAAYSNAETKRDLEDVIQRVERFLEDKEW